MSPERRTALGRRAFVAIATYFVVAIAANALAWSIRFDDRTLENRAFDYGWEIALPWRASHGQWVGRDFAYPIGPLWQALALIPNLGRSFSALRSIVGMHVVFPLLSLGIACLLALRTFRDWPRRAAAFGSVALLALHDDVRSFRILVSLAIVVAYVPTDPIEDRERRDWRRPLVTGAVAAALSLVSFDVAILGVFSVIAMAGVEALMGVRRRALARFGAFVLGVSVFVAVFAALLAVTGGSFIRLVLGSLSITRTYAFALAIPVSGVNVTAVASFVLLAYAFGLAMLQKRHRDPCVLMWLAGSAPLVARAVVRTDVEHVYSGMMPLTAILVLAALRVWPDRPLLARGAGLLSAIFVLAWFGSYRERPNASSPIAFWHAAKIVTGHERPEHGYDGDLPRITRFLADLHRTSSIACVGLPLGAEVVHALSDTPGPTETELYWSPAMREELAQRIRKERCPWFIDRVASFDRQGYRAGVAFGPERIAVSELYEPALRLGPWTFASRLRSEPLHARIQPLGTSGLGEHEVDLDSKLELRFERALPSDHLVAIDYTFEVSPLTVLSGRAPVLVGNFWQGERAVTSPTGLALEINRRATAIMAVHPEFAEWRWIAGDSPRIQVSAEKLRLGVEGRGTPLGAMRLTIHGLTEISPPESAREPAPAACEARVDLVTRARERGFARAVSPEFTQSSIVVAPNARGERLAEVFAPARPCSDSCLFAELFVDSPMGTGDGVDYEVHVIDGAERPRLVDWHVDPGISPKLVALPLRKWASRDVLIRFGTRSGKTTLGDRARFDRPRIGPCLSQRNLVHDLHAGALEVVRGTSRVLGDTLELDPAERHAPETEMRLAIEPAKNSCLALDFQAKRRSPQSVPIAIEAAIVENDESIRLARVEIEPDAPLISFKDLALGEWAGHHAKLQLTTWPLIDGQPALAVIFRPRIHTCGDPARWEFDRGDSP